jgi:uncharacterized protein YraI
MVQDNPQRQKSRWKRGAAPALLAMAMVATWVWAEEATVSRNQTDILGGKNSMYPILATAHKGDTLEVEDHEGSWMKVKFGTVEGYVLQSSLSGQDVTITHALGEGTAGSNDVTASAAAKGWDSTTWSQSHSYSLDGLKAMQATRDRLRANPQAFDQFQADGHVGLQ